MKLSKILALLFACTCIISACKKDDDNVAPTKTATLTAKAWKIKAITTTPALPPGLPIDVDAIIQATLGNLSNSDIKFESDGTYKATNRTTGVVTTDKWKFSDNQEQLIITSENEIYTFKVEDLSATNLNLSLPYSTTFSGFPITITVNIELIPG